MNLLDRLRDIAAEVPTQIRLDRQIRQAVLTDPDAARIFASAREKPQRWARDPDDPRFQQRTDELQRYAEIKSKKGQMHLFSNLFD